MKWLGWIVLGIIIILGILLFTAEIPDVKGCNVNSSAPCGF